MNISILLTTTVNTQKHISWLKQRNSEKRRKMYENIIKMWLDKTKFNIVVVENSGYSFDNLKKYISNRFEIISFTYPKKDKKILDKLVAKGQHEMYSIQYACNNSQLIKSSNFIVKITGRYFIPSLERILIKSLNKNIECIRQSLLWRKMNRCEVVGCSTILIDKIFYFPLKNDEMEQEMMDRMKKFKKILNLPQMKLHKPTRQGVGVLVKVL